LKNKNNCVIVLTKLLLGSGSGFLTTVEVVNLDESNPSLVCDNLPELPFGLEGAEGQLFKGRPVVCGGRGNESIHCDCFALENGGWNPIQSLSECRAFGSSAIFTMLNDESLFFEAGGYGEATSSTVESLDGSSWSSDLFEDLPEPANLHCMAQISNSTFLIIGGKSASAEYHGHTFFFNAVDNVWSEGPLLKVPRRAHKCSVLDWINPATNETEKVVVVAGGYGGQYLSSVELLFVNEYESSAAG
jgi:hypothetical protein